MGEGTGFIEPATLKPEAWTHTLEVWQERAMLSSKPVGSWGAEERAIARDLDLSLGRATIEGLTALPELLGLDSEADRPAMRAYGFSGGLDLKPLPLPLRSDPYRWLASAPPAVGAGPRHPRPPRLELAALPGTGLGQLLLLRLLAPLGDDGGGGDGRLGVRGGVGLEPGPCLGPKGGLFS